jgi:hypothetical protein
VVKNAKETDVDCGGGVCSKCATGKGCALGSDCQSAVCKAGLCLAATCSDGAKNGAETDIDCGGGTCATCATGKACGAGADCQSGVCTGGVCLAATCTDTVKNGTETDKDCGGGTCAACGVGKACLIDSDCNDGECAGGICQPGLGCAVGRRRGFLDEAAWPKVAACGAPVSYSTAVASAPTVCAAGWSMCSVAQTNALSGPDPVFSGSSSLAWINYTDATTSNWYEFSSLSCGVPVGIYSNLAGTGACTPGGQYPEGWRLAVVGGSAFNVYSHQSSVGCVQHVLHECGFAGGSSPLNPAYTLCCKP